MCRAQTFLFIVKFFLDPFLGLFGTKHGDKLWSFLFSLPRLLSDFKNEEMSEEENDKRGKYCDMKSQHFFFGPFLGPYWGPNMGANYVGSSGAFVLSSAAF